MVSNDTSHFSSGLSEAKRHAKIKPRFAEFVCEYHEVCRPYVLVEGNESSRQVYRYVALVTKSVIPNSFWGSKHNLRLILRCQLQLSLPRLLKSLNSREDVEQFISCRKHESLSLHHVIQGFRTSDCDWLAPSGNVSQKYRMCVSDAKKRKELLEDFLFWYFDGFVSPLLKVIRPRNEIQ
jgi:telomerase reverse transcriptase